MREALVKYVNADSRKIETEPDGWYQTAITSPPYYGLRVYGEDGREIGNEQTPEEYVAQLVTVAREVRRVLRDDGTFFLNIGDTYAGNRAPKSADLGPTSQFRDRKISRAHTQQNRKLTAGLKDKDLIGIPWMVATALRADGWYLRQEIIWGKAISFGDRHARNMRKAVVAACIRNGMTPGRAERVASVIEPQIGACMPNSVEDRFTTSHEQIFLFAKTPDYFFDIEAVKERGKDWGERLPGTKMDEWKAHNGKTGIAPHAGFKERDFSEKGRNLRTVWTIGTHPYKGDHYAAFPPALVKPMIKAATSEKGCCPICGAAAVRIVEKKKLTRNKGRAFVKRTGAAGTGNVISNFVDGVATKTIGWRACCYCEGIYPEGLIPCRVIDPFGGVGSTAIGANDLGRDCTLVELLAKNLAEAERRITAHIDERKHGKREAADPNQLNLFDDGEEGEIDETTEREGPPIEVQTELFAEQSNGDAIEEKPADHAEAPIGLAPVAADS